MQQLTRLVVIATAALIICVSAAGCTSNVANQTPNVANQSSTPASQTASAGGNMATYSSGNFTILYPTGWVNATNKARTLDTFSVTCTTKNNTFVGAVESNASVPIDLSRLTTSHVADLRNRSGVTVIEASNTTLAGSPAYKVVYTATASGVTQKTMEIATVKGSNEYIITYRASPDYYDAYAATAQKMIDSFQIT
jgi:hypothetical protein